MKKFGALRMACISLVVCVATAIVSPAQTLTTLHSFSGTDGSHPYAGLLQASDGNFYGTSSSNGAYGNGTVFQITPVGTLTTLHSFAGPDGSNPTDGLVQAIDGNLYGTTFGGGASNNGTVFKISLAGTLTTLHSFAGTDGSGPTAGVVQGTSGNLYGTTTSGGANGYGTIFQITTAGTLTTLHSFTGADGSSPNGVVQARNGNFYGTAASGGTSSYGTVFVMGPTGKLTVLHSFTGTDGCFPSAGVVQAIDGNFYGTTYQCGANGDGTVFKISSTGVLTTLHSFGGSDGSGSYASLMQATDGNLYGTTEQGGADNYGTIFEITTAGALTTLHSFISTDGSYPMGALVQSADRNLYGTTEQGGAYTYYGTVFKLAVGLQPFTNLFTFDGNDGAAPWGVLVQATDGNFYGTTPNGGRSNGEGNTAGTVFKITSTGTLTTVYLFCSQPNCTDGSRPFAGLVQGTDGNFYGTTEEGGAYGMSYGGAGTVFKITPAGVLTSLYSFCAQTGCPDEGFPYAGLVQGTDGNFYGTASGDSFDGYGTVFKITPQGTLTTLHTFSGPDGYLPTATLVQGTNGDFYGTTSFGGANCSPAGCGTVFKITPAGKLTTLYSFCAQTNCPDGDEPYYAGLMQAIDGNFYGTTYAGGAYGSGTVFEITPAGTLTTLHSFSGTDGENPFGTLVQGTDGNAYGTTNAGGSYGYGTAFKITPAGTLTTLYNFCAQVNCADGDNPIAGLMQATDGNFYGTTSGLVDQTNGTVFELSVSLAPFIETVPTSGKVGAPVILLGTNLTGTTSVSFNGTAATFTVVSSSEITTTVPAGATGGSVTVVTPQGTLTSNVAFRVTPQIKTFSPSSGAVGTVVTITGVSLTQTEAVYFGGVKATAFTVVSDTDVQVTVPTGAKTGHITITTAGGTATSTGTFTVT